MKPTEKAPLVLATTFWGKMGVLAYDLFMLIQLLVLYAACFVMLPFFFYEKKKGEEKFFNGFIRLVNWIANFKFGK